MMNRILAVALAGAMALAGAAQAHGPARQKVEQNVVLNATPAEVWEAIGRFDDMGWHPAVASTEMQPEGAPADVPEESVRVLHLKADSGDPTLTERLIAYDPEKRMYRYIIENVDVNVLPVNNYASRIEVRDKNGKADVHWQGAFYRGYPNNDPPPELNDEAAIAAVSAIYEAGLNALAERFGRAE